MLKNPQPITVKGHIPLETLSLRLMIRITLRAVRPLIAARPLKNIPDIPRPLLSRRVCVK
jgi:hypothetical protein